MSSNNLFQRTLESIQKQIQHHLPMDTTKVDDIGSPDNKNFAVIWPYSSDESCYGMSVTEDNDGNLFMGVVYSADMEEMTSSKIYFSSSERLGGPVSASCLSVWNSFWEMNKEARLEALNAACEDGDLECHETELASGVADTVTVVTDFRKLCPDMVTQFATWQTTLKILETWWSKWGVRRHEVDVAEAEGKLAGFEEPDAEEEGVNLSDSFEHYVTTREQALAGQVAKVAI